MGLEQTVAIPSFIQGISTPPPYGGGVQVGIGRNPFLYSGHFNIFILIPADYPENSVAIPSFIQGISTPLLPFLIRR